MSTGCTHGHCPFRPGINIPATARKGQHVNKARFIWDVLWALLFAILAMMTGRTWKDILLLGTSEAGALILAHISWVWLRWHSPARAWFGTIEQEENLHMIVQQSLARSIRYQESQTLAVVGFHQRVPPMSLYQQIRVNDHVLTGRHRTMFLRLDGTAPVEATKVLDRLHRTYSVEWAVLCDVREFAGQAGDAHWLDHAVANTASRTIILAMRLLSFRQKLGYAHTLSPFPLSIVSQNDLDFSQFESHQDLVVTYTSALL